MTKVDTSLFYNNMNGILTHADEIIQAATPAPKDKKSSKSKISSVASSLSGMLSKEGKGSSTHINNSTHIDNRGIGNSVKIDNSKTEVHIRAAKTDKEIEREKETQAVIARVALGVIFAAVAAVFAYFVGKSYGKNEDLAGHLKTLEKDSKMLGDYQENKTYPEGAGEFVSTLKQIVVDIKELKTNKKNAARIDFMMKVTALAGGVIAVVGAIVASYALIAVGGVAVGGVFLGMLIRLGYRAGKDHSAEKEKLADIVSRIDVARGALQSFVPAPSAPAEKPGSTGLYPNPKLNADVYGADVYGDVA